MPMLVFARKPRDLEEAIANARPAGGTVHLTEIVETVALTADDYDRFASDLLADRDWLAGKGGWKRDGTRLAIAVTAPGRRTLFVDPSGASYARYVAIDPD